MYIVREHIRRTNSSNGVCYRHIGRARKHGVAFTLLCFSESVRLDEILKYMESKPTYLKFDDMGTLRFQEGGQAFFENM